MNAIGVLEALERGQTAIDLDNALREVSAAVESNGGKGSVTLKLTVKHLDEGGALVLMPEITTRRPARQRTSSVFFSDPVTHELSRNNPRQADMFDEPEMVVEVPARKEQAAS